MPTISTPRRGEALQAQLQRFFALVTSSGSGNFGQFTELRSELSRLHREGWRLTVSAKDSPADKAGIDFVWSHSRGWFPLDAKAVGMPCSPLVHLVPVGESQEAGECGLLCFEDKMAFLQLLVDLAGKEQPIPHQVLAVPLLSEVEPAQLLAELKNLQCALNAAAVTTGDWRFGQWAETLRRAIGYALSQIRPAGHNTVAADLAQGIVKEALDRFLAELFDPKKPKLENCMHQRTSLNRSRHLCYILSEDALKVAAGGSGQLVVLKQFSGTVARRYQEVLAEAMKIHSSAEWVLTRRRFFETKGVECAIHAVLDALQQRGRELSLK